ncbi:MAG TPA: hypothetical protein VLD39_07665, partial [Gammaproteobacteria bacterium]|nr:hypothetical protein [Gammaproteobacteria bacterium]
MSDTAGQQRIVLWAYVIQWIAIFMPLVLAALLVYVLIARRRVVDPALRSHLDWQLVTCLVAAATMVVAAVLFIIGLSGISTDAPISIVATFTLLALVTVAPLWLLYRVVRG